MAYLIKRWESEGISQYPKDYHASIVPGYKKARQSAAYQLLKYKFRANSLVSCVWFEVINTVTKQTVYKTSFKRKEKS